MKAVIELDLSLVADDMTGQSMADIIRDEVEKRIRKYVREEMENYERNIRFLAGERVLAEIKARDHARNGD